MPYLCIAVPNTCSVVPYWRIDRQDNPFYYPTGMPVLIRTIACLRYMSGMTEEVRSSFVLLGGSNEPRLSFGVERVS